MADQELMAAFQQWMQHQAQDQTPSAGEQPVQEVGPPASRPGIQPAALQHVAHELRALSDELEQAAARRSSASQTADRALSRAHPTVPEGGDGKDARQSVAALQGIVGEVRSVLETVRQVQRRTMIVESIAIKSNMVSLNAAIEAARFGREGAGFSVVARSMRELAEESRAAARGIAFELAGGVRALERLAAGTEVALGRGTQAVEDAVSSLAAVQDDLADLARGLQQDAQTSESVADRLMTLVNEVEAAL